MSDRPRRDTMDDAELTMLALEIMQDFRQLSTMGNIDSGDSYIFKFDDNTDHHDIVNDDDNDDDDDELIYLSELEKNPIYPSYPLESTSIDHNRSITIISHSSMDSLNNMLPPIPSPKKPIKPSLSIYTYSPKKPLPKLNKLKINIPGNKKRGIKRWSKKQKNINLSPNTPSASISKSYIINNDDNPSNDIYTPPPSNANVSPSYSSKTKISHSTSSPSNVSPTDNIKNELNPSIDRTPCISPIKRKRSTQNIEAVDFKQNNNNIKSKKKGRKYKQKKLIPQIQQICDSTQCKLKLIKNNKSNDTKKSGKKNKRKKKKIKNNNNNNNNNKYQQIDANPYDIMNVNNADSPKQPLPYFVKRGVNLKNIYDGNSSFVDVMDNTQNQLVDILIPDHMDNNMNNGQNKAFSVCHDMMNNDNKKPRFDVIVPDDMVNNGKNGKNGKNKAFSVCSVPSMNAMAKEHNLYRMEAKSIRFGYNQDKNIKKKKKKKRKSGGKKSGRPLTPQPKSKRGKRNKKIQKRAVTPIVGLRRRRDKKVKKKRNKGRASSIESSRYNNNINNNNNNININNNNNNNNYDENEYAIEVEDGFIFINDFNKGLI